MRHDQLAIVPLATQFNSEADWRPALREAGTALPQLFGREKKDEQNIQRMLQAYINSFYLNTATEKQIKISRKGRNHPNFPYSLYFLYDADEKQCRIFAGSKKSALGFGGEATVIPLYEWQKKEDGTYFIHPEATPALALKIFESVIYQRSSAANELKALQDSKSNYHQLIEESPLKELHPLFSDFKPLWISRSQSIEEITKKRMRKNSQVLSLSSRNLFEEYIVHKFCVPQRYFPGEDALKFTKFYQEISYGSKAYLNHFRKALHFCILAGKIVEEAHQENIVLCDLKLENFILNIDNSVALIDTHMAKKIQKEMQIEIGTLHFAPAEFHQLGKYTKASEYYAFGLFALRLLGGKDLFLNLTEADLMKAYEEEKSRFDVNFLAGLEIPIATKEKLITLFSALLSYDPDKRPSISESIATFKECLNWIDVPCSREIEPLELPFTDDSDPDSNGTTPSLR